MSADPGRRAVELEVVESTEGGATSEFVLGFLNGEVEAAEAFAATTDERTSGCETASAVARAGYWSSRGDGRAWLAGAGGETSDATGEATYGAEGSMATGDGTLARAEGGGGDVPGHLGAVIFKCWDGVTAEFDFLEGRQYL